MRGNSHVRFGGGRLEKQVMLLAGRLPDSIYVKNRITRGDIVIQINETSLVCVSY